MLGHIFDSPDANYCPAKEIKIYRFDQTPNIHLIRKIVQQQRKKRRLTKLTNVAMSKPKDHHLYAEKDQVPSGLPSPPIESTVYHPSMPSTPESFSLSVEETEASLIANESSEFMTDSDIQQKLVELKEEKHRLFQWIKRLVHEEQEREYKKKEENAKNNRRWSTATQFDPTSIHEASRHCRSIAVSNASPLSLYPQKHHHPCSSQEGHFNHAMPPSPPSLDF